MTSPTNFFHMSQIRRRCCHVTKVCERKYHNLNFIRIWPEKVFKCNNLGLALDMALKFYTSVAKGSKLKVRKFREENFVVSGRKFCRSYRGKTGRGSFLPSPILNRINNSYIKGKEICPAYISKINSNCEKQIIMLMIPNEEKEDWHYLALKDYLHY